MTSLLLILVAIGLLSASGLPACGLSFRSAMGQRISALLLVIGSLLGLGGVIVGLSGGEQASMQMAWMLPWGQFSVAIDTLSLFFLAPVFVVPALGAIYALGYWPQREHPGNGQRLGFFYGLLAGCMAMVLIARDGVLFLIAWEIMALAAYFAATAEEHKPEVRRAGWVYLVATHIGTLALFAMFAVWRHSTGSFALAEAGAISTEVAGTIFVLALIGFGFKAGLMPLHVWLPGAHANAPSHVSAVMSGVMLKMGIYGIVRMTAILPAPQGWWGGVLLTVGAITGIAGIAFAIGQQDIKRLLAYSSIENIGIIAMGLGLASLGRSQGRDDLVILGFAGAMLHVWNHALFKSLLFMLAGAVMHATGTREMDVMGGLAKRMPRAAMLFTIGAVAICALPPLNGFVSEWLLYIGLFHTLAADKASALPAAAIGSVALALIGALAVACFVKLFATVFLGEARTPTAAHAHDPGFSMMAPMVALALGCLAIGLLPFLAVGLLQQSAAAWSGSASAALPPILTLAPLHWISLMGLGIFALLAVFAAARRTLPRSRIIETVGTWDCGYARPTSRMQYTGSSLGEMLVGLFAFITWPRRREPRERQAFPARSSFGSIVPDTVLDRLVAPAFALADQYMPRLRVLQSGQTQIYTLYLLIAVIILFVIGAIGV